ncbi:hypothetical protein PTKIN_Ptkin06aG0124600 [Pterospermum kingtungense]
MSSSSSSSRESEATETFVKETLRLDEQVKEWAHEYELNNENDPKLIPTSSLQSVVVEPIFLSQSMERPNHGTKKKGGSSGSSSSSIEASNDYRLPTSTLPPDFRLGFSSTLQIQQGNWTNHVSSQPKTNWTNRSQEFGFQALLNQVIASDNFPANDDRPIQQRVGSRSIGVSSPFLSDGIPRNPNKRKISRQDETTPTPNLPFIDWMSLGEGDQGAKSSVTTATASGSRSKFIKNKVYDPSYAAKGLPLDPHLRMFLAKSANENKDKGKDCGSKTPRKAS